MTSVDELRILPVAFQIHADEVVIVEGIFARILLVCGLLLMKSMVASPA
jgi:hypothetical protein